VSLFFRWQKMVHSHQASGMASLEILATALLQANGGHRIIISSGSSSSSSRLGPLLWLLADCPSSGALQWRALLGVCLRQWLLSLIHVLEIVGVLRTTALNYASIF